MSVEIINDKLDSLFSDEKDFADGKVNDDWHIQQFQYFFFLLQQLYFNGQDIDRGTKLFIPLRKGQNKFTRECINILTAIRRSHAKGYMKESTIEAFIMSSHSYLKDCITNQNIPKKQILNTSKYFDTAFYNRHDAAYFKPIINLVKDLNNSNENRCIENIFLTNSLVSMDYQKGYSDADCLVILKHSVFDSKDALSSTRKLLIRLSKYLYLFDPLQHHGFIIISELDQSYYPQAYYPSLLFENSCTLMEGGSAKLSYRYRDDSMEKSVALYKNLKSLNHYAHLNHRSFSLFTLKRFVSNITLLPVLYFQQNGEYIYKKDAFLRLDEYFKNRDIFKSAERIRNKFPYRRYFNKFPSFLHPTLIPILHGYLNNNKLFKDTRQLNGLCVSFLNEFICQIENGEIQSV